MEKHNASYRFILWGVPTIFLLGVLFHYIYEWTGRFFPIGFIVPVNESIFEHLKLIPLPLLLWWGLYAIRNRHSLDLNRWLTGELAALLTALATVPLLYYTYTGALGIENMWVDIGLLLVALLLGQLLGLHVFIHGKGLNYQLALAVLLLIPVVFALFTAFPPQLPFFQDSTSGTYGIFGNCY